MNRYKFTNTETGEIVYHRLHTDEQAQLSADTMSRLLHVIVVWGKVDE